MLPSQFYEQYYVHLTSFANPITKAPYHFVLVLYLQQEATEMLLAREEQAKELERKTRRAATMTEVEVLELRAEIKVHA